MLQFFKKSRLKSKLLSLIKKKKKRKSVLRQHKRTLFCFTLLVFIRNNLIRKLEFGVFSRTHTWPSPFLLSKVFIEFITFHLLIEKRGVTTEKSIKGT